METEYNLNKTGDLEIIAVDGKPTLMPIIDKKYYIRIETNDKKFLNFMDNEINNLIKRYECGD